ncbi:peptidoglycan-binding protein [Bradyrhizobium prioriisuperbiae]|uniref:peptidoglycan-binding protein n=1 Tax=Bradyrhizobium prioriisuperbiae TaxID=2854389 RepID=UPI0028E756B0|nr:peptidoglycan-binding protein [Bradyrhizobium prioritasuperba]
MTEQILVRSRKGGCRLCAPRSEGHFFDITGSVGRHGRNQYDDVRRIQAALNSEKVTDGGPMPRLALNGICDQDTIAAIENYQRHQKIGRADGRVDPNGATMKALNRMPKPTAAVNDAFIAKIGGLLPKARRWTESAQLKIDMAIEYARKGKLDRHDPFPALHDIGKREMDLFNKYFHADKVSQHMRLHQLQSVRNIYGSMQTVLTGSLLEAPMFGWGVGHFQPDPMDGTAASDKYAAYTFYGGWHQRRRDGTPRLSGDDNYAGPRRLRQDTIFFAVSGLLGTADNELILTIIHELAHFVGPPVNSSARIGDHTYDTHANFLKVSNWTALRTADLYAYFAAEAALKNITIPLS